MVAHYVISIYRCMCLKGNLYMTNNSEKKFKRNDANYFPVFYCCHIQVCSISVIFITSDEIHAYHKNTQNYSH